MTATRPLLIESDRGYVRHGPEMTKPKSYIQRKQAEQRAQYGEFIKKASAEKLAAILRPSCDPYNISWLIRELRQEFKRK